MINHVCRGDSTTLGSSPDCITDQFCWTLGSYLKYLSLSFPPCKMGIIMPSLSIEKCKIQYTLISSYMLILLFVEKRYVESKMYLIKLYNENKQKVEQIHHALLALMKPSKSQEGWPLTFTISCGAAKSLPFCTVTCSELFFFLIKWGNYIQNMEF